VDAEVSPVGLEPNGEMEIPPATQAGWYLHGPRPGEADGTAVIAAHVDYGGQRGVFYDLRGLAVGGEVSVTDQAGAVHRYVVVERYQVDKDELPIEQIFVADGPPGLTLITCGGAFDRGARSYDDNIVVRAVPT
jgi:sortase (surface protein transpeptidase)